MRVAVMGSGMAGLACAAGLQRLGGEVLVLEQSADLRPGGSGLSIFGNGVRALDALGLGERLRAVAPAPTDQLRAGQRRPDGSWLSTTPRDALTELRVVDRADLHGLLVSALRDGTIERDARVVSVGPDGTLGIRGAGGRERQERFDLVVGADGLRSTARRTWPDDPGVRYAGYSAWRGITERPVDVRGAAGETWGAGLRFGMAPLGDGRVYWFAVASMPADREFASETTALWERFGRWHDPIPALLDATPAGAVHRLPIEELAGSLRSYVRDRVVLVGDAAHAMTPNLGQGGGMALEDAATLATLVGPVTSQARPDPRGLAGALQRYDSLRRPRTQLVAQRSRLLGQLGQLGRAHGSAHRFRDSAIALTPAWVVRRQLAWLQDWRLPTP